MVTAREKKEMIREGMLLAFGEFFLKSAGVQKILRRKLLWNLSFFLKKKKVDFGIISFRERIFVEAKNISETSEIVKNIFGIAWFARSFFLKNATLGDLSDFVKENYKNWINEGESFALRLSKSGAFEKSRDEIIKEVAENIEREVNLDTPQKEIFIEGRKEGWFVYFKKERGAGGLPAQNQGKVLSLISGGIDSPVAAYLIAKRGAENIWIHFHSFPLVSRASIEKTKELAEVFLNYQPKLKVYFVPFSEIQKGIKTNIPAKYRVLMYRRLMFKIAELTAKKEGCRALVTGESLGQVSSQTLQNIEVTQCKLKTPVFRPLIGMDKEEIVQLAKKIETFEISIKAQEDCCTLFVPKHQTAAGDIEEIQKFEKKLNLNKQVLKAIKEIEVESF